jgi:hypothetical protein
MDGGINGGYMPNASNLWIKATTYARDLVMKMSEHVFANYPDSRVAVMGLNAVSSNTNAAERTFLQFDTPFVGASGYSSVISKTLNGNVRYMYSDNAQFLRAAIDKMKGDASVLYGGRSVTPKNVVPRDELGAGRIPCIVHISDFQMRLQEGGWGAYPLTDYWTDAMKGQADRYAKDFPNGILMTVRLDHKYTIKAISPPSSIAPDGPVNSFSNAPYDNLMTANVSPAGRAKWRFTKLAHTDNATAGLNKVKSAFNAVAPPRVVVSVKDTIPDGLSIVSTNPAGVVNGQTVTWDLTDAPVGNISLTIVTKVIGPPPSGVSHYANTATLSVQGKSDVNTNTTYHRFWDDLVLHLRQVVVSPASVVPKPLVGYFSLKNDGRAMQVTAESGVDGFSVTDYSTYKLIPGGKDSLYLVHDFVPQHYEFAGHFQNRGSSPASGHGSPAAMVLPSASPNGQTALDYGVDDEYWLTVYIRPVGAPGDFEWNYASNDFGAVG